MFNPHMRNSFFPKNGCSEKINLIIHNVDIQDIWCLPTLPKIALVCERFCWGTMLHDIQSWVKNCQHCKTVKGPYTDPEPPQGSVVVNNPMDLLYLDFMKLDPSESGKENVLVMTDVFSKFNVVVITQDQRAKTVVKVLVDEWFYTYRIPADIHSDQGKTFNNHIIEQL